MQITVFLTILFILCVFFSPLFCCVKNESAKFHEYSRSRQIFIVHAIKLNKRYDMCVRAQFGLNNVKESNKNSSTLWKDTHNQIAKFFNLISISIP